MHSLLDIHIQCPYTCLPIFIMFDFETFIKRKEKKSINEQQIHRSRSVKKEQ